MYQFVSFYWSVVFHWIIILKIRFIVSCWWNLGYLQFGAIIKFLHILLLKSFISLSLFFFLFFFFLFFLFRDAPTAYGSSQAEGHIGAAVSGLCTATAMPDPSCVWGIYHSSQNARSLTHWERPGIKPESSVDSSRVCYC